MSRIVRPTALGSPDVLEAVDVPVPGAPAGGVVVRVRAAEVNPIDWKIYSGTFHAVADEHKDAHGAAADLRGLGLECAGVVTEVGDGVDGVLADPEARGKLVLVP